LVEFGIKFAGFVNDKQMVEIGTLLQDRYLIERQIGEGGMGAVYLAVDQKFGSHVAIKETFFQEEDLGEAFEREARLLNNLHHPILPHVSDYFVEDGRHFLLMEFIEGEDLSEILAREGAFPLEDVLRWTNELLDALDYLHSHKPPIVHRDIKPNNLKLTSRGNIILLDFGLAKLTSGDALGVKSIFGYSRRYSPLEQIQGTGTDARSDIFSLGATVFHLLTGKQPVDVLARAAVIVAGKPDPLQFASEINNQVPLGVAQVIQTALALNADRRFNSAKAMRKALEYAVNSYSTFGDEQSTKNVAIDKSSKQILTPVETESFPALESFAAEVAESEPGKQENSESAPNNIEIPIIESPSKTPEVAPKPVIVSESAGRTRRIGKPYLAIAACLALLFCGALTVWYATNQTKSSSEQNQNPVIQSNPTPTAIAEQTPIVSDSPKPAISNKPLSENVAQSKVKPTIKDKTVVETVKTPVEIVAPVEPPSEPEKNEKPVKAKIQTPTPRSAPAQTPRPRAKQPPAVNQPAVSSIETIMTGVPSDKQQPRDNQRQQQMSDDEKNEQSRRRAEDVLRQNRQPVRPN
jgi:serine/threonine protein kinase